MITKEKTAKKMAESLIYHAKQNEKSLKGLTKDNFNDFLDSLFNDGGGEIRCENFTDLAINYSLQFGDLESFPAMTARWECAVLAIEIINNK